MKIAALLIALSLPVNALDLRITEVMTDSLNGGDWFEVTNFEETPTTMSGFHWQDQNELDPLIPIPETTLQPGESVILVIGRTADFFRTWWDLEADVQVIDFVNRPDLKIPRFSPIEDEVHLFDAEGELVDFFKTGNFFEGLSQSKLVGGTKVPYLHSLVGQHGYRESAGMGKYDNGLEGKGRASPGEVAEEAAFPPNFDRRFFHHEWPAGLDLANSTFRIKATDPNPSSELTISAINLPNWLTIVNEGNRTARLAGTPPEGVHGAVFFEILVTDETGLTSKSEDDTRRVSLMFDILPLSGPIVLNEYNGVVSGRLLGDREDEVPPRAFDTRLGRVKSNGRFWMEFVVVGNGNGPEEVDLRGWRFELASHFGEWPQTFSFQLTDNPALARIPAGTILTITAGDEISPTVFNDDSMARSEGYFWTNLNLFDLSVIDFPEHRRSSAPGVNQRVQFEVTVTTADGDILLGPAGERSARRDPDQDGIFEKAVKVGMDEIFKLEADPTPQTSPIFGPYDDGFSSTFGAPNEWNDRTSKQSFLRYRPDNLPPKIVASLPSHCVRGVYEGFLSFSDPEGEPVAVSLVNSPDFLAVTATGPGEGRLHLSREITPDDWGTHTVTIQADDGSDFYSAGHLTYRLTVSNPAPTVIVNEFNAVSRTTFLNGGTRDMDLDGDPAAADLAFGRIQGNGGNWMELVVVGDGGPSSVDIRGWKIQTGRMENGGAFREYEVLQLAHHPDFGAVPAGTILLFGVYEILETPSEGNLKEDGWHRINISYRRRHIHAFFPERVGLELGPVNNLVRIVDRDGKVIFGPIGETTINGVQLGNDEVFELEAHPSPSISIHDSAATPGAFGYDDSDSESTMGLPNRFLDENGLTVTQDFRRFIPTETTFGEWAGTFGLPDDSQMIDSDGDGSSNLDEYLAGTLPNDPGSQPTKPGVTGFPENRQVVYDIRVNDPLYQYHSEMSSDLLNWTSEGLLATNTPSPKGNAFRRRILEENRPPPFAFENRRPPSEKLFFRNIPFRVVE